MKSSLLCLSCTSTRRSFRPNPPLSHT